MTKMTMSPFARFALFSCLLVHSLQAPSLLCATENPSTIDRPSVAEDCLTYFEATSPRFLADIQAKANFHFITRHNNTQLFLGYLNGDASYLAHAACQAGPRTSVVDQQGHTHVVTLLHVKDFFKVCGVIPFDAVHRSTTTPNHDVVIILLKHLLQSESLAAIARRLPRDVSIRLYYELVLSHELAHIRVTVPAVDDPVTKEFVDELFADLFSVSTLESRHSTTQALLAKRIELRTHLSIMRADTTVPRHRVLTFDLMADLFQRVPTDSIPLVAALLLKRLQRHVSRASLSSDVAQHFREQLTSLQPSELQKR